MLILVSALNKLQDDFSEMFRIVDVEEIDALCAEVGYGIKYI